MKKSFFFHSPFNKTRSSWGLIPSCFSGFSLWNQYLLFGFLFVMLMQYATREWIDPYLEDFHEKRHHESSHDRAVALTRAHSDLWRFFREKKKGMHWPQEKIESVFRSIAQHQGTIITHYNMGSLSTSSDTPSLRPLPSTFFPITLTLMGRTDLSIRAFLDHCAQHLKGLFIIDTFEMTRAPYPPSVSPKTTESQEALQPNGDLPLPPAIRMTLRGRWLHQRIQ